MNDTVDAGPKRLATHLSQMQQLHQAAVAAPEYGWRADDWPNPALANTQIAKTSDLLDVPLRATDPVPFGHGKSCPSRAYILVQPQHVG